MINDLKSKIPALNKKKQIDETEDENAQDSSEATHVDLSAGDKTSSTDISNLDQINEETESHDLDDAQEDGQAPPKSIVDKLKALLNNKKKASTDKKPDKKKVIILGAILILAILFLFEDESTQNGGEEASESSAQKAMEEKIAKRKRDREAAKKKNLQENQTPDQKVETANTPEDTSKLEQKNEGANATTPENASAPITESSEPAKDLTEDSLGLEPPSKLETSPVDVDTAKAENTEPEVVKPETTETKTTDSEDGNKVEETLPTDSKVSASPSESTGQDTVDESTSTEQNTDLTEKILEDLEKKVKNEAPREQKKEYVTPPDYEYLGRGLVYNCSGKHWACVDGPSYKVCEDNYSSVQYLKKPIECYPFNVYETQRGCESMQNRVVSSNAKTNFCNGN